MRGPNDEAQRLANDFILSTIQPETIESVVKIFANAVAKLTPADRARLTTLAGGDQFAELITKLECLSDPRQARLRAQAMFELSPEQEPAMDQIELAKLALEREAFALSLEPDVNTLLTLHLKSRRPPEES